MIKKYFFFLITGLLLIAYTVSAQVAEGPSLFETITKNSYFAVTVGGIFILFLVILAALNTNSSNVFKIIIFVLIVLISLGVTFYLVGVTLYVNMKSETGGPVHWHTDFRIFECGKEIFLKEPTGLSNRIGRTDLHEHGDKRIHVEGVVVEKQDVSLYEFFRTIGGNLGYGELSFPGRKKYEQLINGNKCIDETVSGSANLQVFLYKTEGKTISQNKLINYPEYVLSSESRIPPGDCLIFEFTPDEKEKTENICDFTSIAIQKGEYNYIK